MGLWERVTYGSTSSQPWFNVYWYNFTWIILWNKGSNLTTKQLQKLNNLVNKILQVKYIQTGNCCCWKREVGGNFCLRTLEDASCPEMRKNGRACYMLDHSMMNKFIWLVQMTRHVWEVHWLVPRNKREVKHGRHNNNSNQCGDGFLINFNLSSINLLFLERKKISTNFTTSPH